MPNSQSFIQQCVEQTSSEIIIATCTATVTASPVVTTTVSSIQPEKPIIVSGATTPRTVSVQTLNPLAGPGAAKTGVVTLHSVGSAAGPGGATAGTVLLQTPKPLVTSIQNTVTAVSLQPEKPVVSGAAVTLALPSVTFGETSAAAICLPSVKPVVTSAGTTSDKPVLGAPVQIKLAQPGPILSQPAGIPQAVKVKQLVSNISFLPQFLILKISDIEKTGKTSKRSPCAPLTEFGHLSFYHIALPLPLCSHSQTHTNSCFLNHFGVGCRNCDIASLSTVYLLRKRMFFSNILLLQHTYYCSWEVNVGTIFPQLSQQCPL